jgi:hypothetical protein
MMAAHDRYAGYRAAAAASASTETWNFGKMPKVFENSAFSFSHFDWILDVSQKGGKKGGKGKKGAKKGEGEEGVELTPEEKEAKAKLRIEALEREIGVAALFSLRILNFSGLNRIICTCSATNWCDE